MHERKYRIEPPSGQLVKKNNGVPIPDDEPLFILRSKDVNALPALMAYLVLCKDMEHREEVTKSVVDFRNFRDANPERMKEPDA